MMEEKQNNETYNIRTTDTLPKLPLSNNQNQAFDDAAKAKVIALRNEGYKYKEIADHLGVNINSVKSYIHRLRNDVPRCIQCSKPLPPSTTKKRKFCSEKCRIKWWNDHRDLHKKAATKVCVFCGKEFQCYEPSRKYCSSECYNQSRMKYSPKIVAMPAEENRTEVRPESIPEIKYRIGELLFYLYAEEGIITPSEYEELRNKLIDAYHPVVGELERNMPWEIRKSLK